MFNGIIFNKGLIKRISKRPKGINIFIKSDLKLNSKDIGISVACDGVCLTMISINSNMTPTRTPNRLAGDCWLRNPG